MRVFLFAAMLEAKPFIVKSKAKRIMDKPFKVFSYGDDLILISGIGKGAAAMGAFFACETLKAHSIINCGAAGALKKGYSIGDILFPKKVIEIDRYTIPLGKPARYSLDPIDSPHCTLITRDIPATTAEDRDSLAQYGDIIDMEGGAIAHGVSLFKKKVSCIKIITDSPEENINILLSVKKQSVVLGDYLMDNREMLMSF